MAGPHIDAPRVRHRAVDDGADDPAGAAQPCLELLAVRVDLDELLGDAARDGSKLEREVRRADCIYHFAGQVAVTTSLRQPTADHEANLVSTLALLEAMRACGSSAPLVFASTNKVYGAPDDVPAELVGDRWAYAGGRTGVDESRPLDFHSPYGCSKGCGDQYARDYHRIYGLPTVVFRQSCVYGPRQRGSEGQGWVAHLVIAARASCGWSYRWRFRCTRCSHQQNRKRKQSRPRRSPPHTWSNRRKD